MVEIIFIELLPLCLKYDTLTLISNIPLFLRLLPLNQPLYSAKISNTILTDEFIQSEYF